MMILFKVNVKYKGRIWVQMWWQRKET